MDTHHKKLQILTLFCLSLVLTSCGLNRSAQSAQTAKVDPMNLPYQIQYSDTQSYEYKIVVEKQPNCVGSEALTSNFEVTEPVKYSINFAESVSLLAVSNPDLFGPEGEISQAIAAEQDVDLEAGKMISHSIAIEAAPNTLMEHVISFREIYKTGDVLYTQGNDFMRIPFSVRTDFGLVLVESHDIGCPNAQASQIATEVSGTEQTHFTKVGNFEFELIEAKFVGDNIEFIFSVINRHKAESLTMCPADCRIFVDGQSYKHTGISWSGNNELSNVEIEFPFLTPITIFVTYGPLQPIEKVDLLEIKLAENNTMTMREIFIPFNKP